MRRIPGNGHFGRVPPPNGDPFQAFVVRELRINRLILKEFKRIHRHR
jgi:hypothetical protein